MVSRAIDRLLAPHELAVVVLRGCCPRAHRSLPPSARTPSDLMSEDRWAANLAHLPHAELLAIAAKGCVGDSAAALFASACLGAVLPV